MPSLKRLNKVRLLLMLVTMRAESITEHTQALRGWVRGHGGEEFLVLAPETSSLEAGKLARRLNSAIKATVVTLPASKAIKLTASIGVFSWGAGAAKRLPTPCCKVPIRSFPGPLNGSGSSAPWPF